MTTVGQAKIRFEADTGQVSEQLVSKMDEVLKKVEQMLSRMSGAAEKEAKATGDAIGNEVGRGADQAEDALDGIDGAGLDKVEEAATKAGAALGREVQQGADKADAAVDQVDGSGLSKVEEAAAKAGAAIGSDVAEGATRAAGAIDGIDGSGLDEVAATAAQAAGTIGSELSSAVHAADAALDGIDGHAFREAGAAAQSAASSIKGDVASAAAEASAAIADVGNEADAAFDRGVVGAGLLEGALGKIALAAGALAGPMTVLKKGWDRLTSIDEAEHKLIALGHTTESVSTIMDNAMSAVTGTAFGFGDAAGQAATLVAAGVQPGADLERVLRLVADSASIAGVDLNEMGSIWGKVAASGKLSGQELEMLLDRQIGLLPGLAEMYGVTADEARKMVSDGKVSFEDFAKVMEDMVGGGAEVMGQSVRASFENVGAAAGRLGEALLKPIFQAAPAFLAGVQKGLGMATDAVKGFQEWLNSGSVAADVLKVALIAIGTTATIGAIVGVVSQLGLMAKAADLATKALKFLNFSFLMSGPGLIIMGITAVVAAFVILWNKSEAFREFWKGLWEWVSTPVLEVVDTLKAAWGEVTAVFRGGDDGYAALGSLIGDDNAQRILDLFDRIRIAWGELKAAFTGGDDGYGALESLIGTDAAERVITIVGNVKDAWTELWDAFQGGDSGYGALEQILGSETAETVVNAFARMGDAARLVWDTIKELGSALWQVGQSIASAGWETMKSVFSALVDVGTSLFSAVMDIAGAVWDLVQALAPVLMPILKVIGIIVGGVIVAAFFLLMGALKLVAGLFQVLAKVISWLAENVLAPLIGVIADVVSWLVDKLGGAISGVVDVVTALFQGIGDVFSWVWEQLQAAWDNIGRPVLDFIIGAFEFWWESVTLGFRLLGATFEVIWTGLQMAWDAWGRPVLDFIISGFEFWWNVIKGILDWLRSAWDAAWQWVVEKYHQYVVPVIDWIVQKFGALRDGVQAALDRVKGLIQSAADKVAEFYGRYVQPMVDAVVRGFNRVRDTVTGWKDKLVSALSGAGSWLVNAGRQVVQGFINGIRSLAGTIGSAFLDMVPGWIKGPFKRALGIASPSKVFMGYGRNIGEGLIAGVDDMGDAVRSSTQGLADQAAAIDVPVLPSAVPTAPVMGAPTMAAPVLAQDPAATEATAGAFAGMAESMSAASVDVLDPMWAAQQGQMVLLGETVVTQAQGVVTPTWDLMAQQMAATQAGVIAPTMAAMQAAMTQTALVIATEIGVNIRSALNYFVTLLFWTLNSGVNPVFAGIRGGLQHVVAAFGTGVAAITAQWAQVREATARPVRFTITSVFNDGLVGMWNSVADLLGTKKMGAYPVRFASGGILPGYTPGRDPYTFVEPNTGLSIGLSGGEAIMRPEVARAMGGDWVDGVNAAARMGGPRAVQRFLGNFRGGGVVESITALVRRFWPMMTITSTYRNTPDHHGGGRAVDFSNGYDSTPAMRSATAWFARNYQPALLELIHSPSPFNIKNGRNVGNGFGFYGAGTMNQHRNHVHVAAARPLPMPGGALASVSGDPGMGDWDIAGAFTQEWKDKITTAIKGYRKSGGLIDAWPPQVAEKLTTAADKKIDEMFMSMSGDPGGGDVQRWAPLVSSLLKLYGHPMAWLSNTMRRMNQESGGNPRAINLWDSNAAKGIPSKGLMQVIDPTFAAHRDRRFPNDIWDPRANIAASMRYTMATYGSLPAGYDRPGGYAHGGIMGAGQGLFHKTAFAPERVLSPRQTASFERLVDWIDAQPALPVTPHNPRATSAEYGHHTKTVLVTQNITAADPKATADAVEDRLMALM